MQIEIAGAEIEEPFLRQLMAQKHLGRGNIFVKLGRWEIKKNQITVKDKRRQENQEGKLQTAFLVESFGRHSSSLIALCAADGNMTPVAERLVLGLAAPAERDPVSDLIFPPVG